VSRPRFARRVRGRRALTPAFAPRLTIQLSGECQVLARTCEKVSYPWTKDGAIYGPIRVARALVDSGVWEARAYVPPNGKMYPSSRALMESALLLPIRSNAWMTLVEPEIRTLTYVKPALVVLLDFRIHENQRAVRRRRRESYGSIQSERDSTRSIDHASVVNASGNVTAVTRRSAAPDDLIASLLSAASHLLKPRRYNHSKGDDVPLLD